MSKKKNRTKPNLLNLIVKFVCLFFLLFLFLIFFLICPYSNQKKSTKYRKRKKQNNNKTKTKQNKFAKIYKYFMKKKTEPIDMYI